MRKGEKALEHHNPNTSVPIFYKNLVSISFSRLGLATRGINSLGYELLWKDNGLSVEQITVKFISQHLCKVDSCKQCLTQSRRMNKQTHQHISQV